MPIEKFVRVKNVGRFIDLAAAGDVAFRRLTLIYGDNGTGKTTIAGILRSMKSGDSAHIAERQTVGSTTPVEVDVKVSNAGLLKFRNGSWDTIKNEIEIFDSVFVAENVYAGELVESEHRRNLYQVVVGDTAVALAKRIDEIDSESRAAARAITDLESKIREKMQAPFDLDDFIMLQKADANELSQKIEDRTAQLVAARKSKDVLNRSPLEELQFPASPRDLLKPLTTSVATISKQTEDRVKEHLRLRLDRNGEQWLRQGLAYVQKDNTCPFCTQSLTGTDIVKCFSEHFSTQYKEHVVEVQRLSNEISQRFAEDRLSRIRRIALENEGRIAVWKDLVDLTYATSSIDSLVSGWRSTSRPPARGSVSARAHA